MTSDRLKAAVISWLNTAKPSASITVSDAQAFAAVDLPSLSVGISSAERHSATLHHVQRVNLEIVLQTHSGDTDTRADVQAWCAAIEDKLNDPSACLSIYNASGQQVKCDYWRVNGGVPEWDETTLKTTWTAEALCYRTG